MDPAAGLLLIDPSTALHLSLAIRYYRNLRQAKHSPMPAGLADLEEALTTLANGQQRPDEASEGHAQPDRHTSDDRGDVGQGLLRVMQAAALLDVSPRTVRRLIAGDEPELPSLLVRGARRVRREDLEAYMAHKAGR